MLSPCARYELAYHMELVASTRKNDLDRFRFGRQPVRKVDSDGKSLGEKLLFLSEVLNGPALEEFVHTGADELAIW